MGRRCIEKDTDQDVQRRYSRSPRTGPAPCPSAPITAARALDHDNGPAGLDRPSVADSATGVCSRSRSTAAAWRRRAWRPAPTRSARWPRCPPTAARLRSGLVRVPGTDLAVTTLTTNACGFTAAVQSGVRRAGRHGLDLGRRDELDAGPVSGLPASGSDQLTALVPTGPR